MIRKTELDSIKGVRKLPVFREMIVKKPHCPICDSPLLSSEASKEGDKSFYCSNMSCDYRF